MYYILYEGLKIESNEPVYCTMYWVYIIQCIMYPLYTLHTRLLSVQFLLPYVWLFL